MRRSRRSLSLSRQCAGFTLVEVLLALVITALALVNFHLVTKAGSTAASSGVLQSSINDELDLTVDRISLALMGSSEDDLAGPPRAPANSTFVDYSIVMGYEEGEAVYGPPESISWEMGGDARGSIQWARVEDVAATGGAGVTRELVWSKAVPEAFRGEALGNDVDDNGNGLLNEHGLAFTRDGAAVDIHLTIEHIADGGQRVSIQKKHRITCRN